MILNKSSIDNIKTINNRGQQKQDFYRNVSAQLFTEKLSFVRAT